MIDQYSTGSHMMVKGTKYRKDLKIIQGEVVGNWWRQEGHRLATGVSKQRSDDRRQKSDSVLHYPVFIICPLSSDLCPLKPDT